MAGFANRFGVLVSPFLLTFGLLSCADASRVVDRGIVYDTLGGIEHVTSTGVGVWAEAGTGWAVDEAGGTVIGTIEGEAPYVFGRISGVVVDPDGRIHVADSQAREIRVFSSTGEYLRQVGGSGEGPGEFRHINGLALAPGGVGAVDGSLGRMTVFGFGGELVRTFRLRQTHFNLGHSPAMGFNSLGQFFDRSEFRSRPGIDSVAVMIYAPDGAVVDSAFVAEIEEDLVMIVKDGRPSASFPRPFAPQTSMSFGPEGTLYLSRGAEYRIDVFSPVGDSLRTILRPVEPRHLAESQRDSVRADVASFLELLGGSPDREVELPDLFPVIGGLLVDALGNLWVLNVGNDGGAGTRWSVHDPEGRFLGDLSLPKMTVTQIGSEFIAGSMRDELGVERAVVFPLLKSG